MTGGSVLTHCSPDVEFLDLNPQIPQTPPNDKDVLAPCQVPEARATRALLTFGLDNCDGGRPVHYIIFYGIPGDTTHRCQEHLLSLNMRTKNASRHSPGISSAMKVSLRTQ